MKITSQKDISVEKIVQVLKNDGLIIFPFDTCYGLVCDPTNQKAVDKLLGYKARREGKAISVVVSDFAMAEKFADIHESAKKFIRNFLPGPFTIILKSKNKFAQGVEAENGTIGIRIPSYNSIVELVKTYGSPLTSTSANQSYQKTPYSVQDILENASESALDLIDLIIDAGELEKNPPSTVIDMSNDELHVLRKGSIIPENAKTKSYQSNSEEETIQFARDLMEKYSMNLNFRPLIFALQGDMGAGKTHFTKGLALSLGVQEQIQSPTFIISNEYKLEGRNKLYHIDTWRLSTENHFTELEEIGFKNMLNPISGKFNIISIEWADKIQEYLQKLNANIKIIWVEIIADKEDSNKRIIKWSE